MYRSKTGRISQLIEALTHLHKSVLTEPAIAIILFGDLNINLIQETTVVGEGPRFPFFAVVSHQFAVVSLWNKLT